MTRPTEYGETPNTIGRCFECQKPVNRKANKPTPAYCSKPCFEAAMGRIEGTTDDTPQAESEAAQEREARIERIRKMLAGDVRYSETVRFLLDEVDRLKAEMGNTIKCETRVGSGSTTPSPSARMDSVSKEGESAGNEADSMRSAGKRFSEHSDL